MELLTAIDPLAAAAVALGVALVLAALSLRRVPQGFEYCLERAGRFRRVLRPGLHMVLPLVDRVGARQDMRERTLTLERSTMLTRDRVSVQVDATAFFQVVDAARASYEVESLDVSLRALLAVSLRTLVGERTLEEVITGRGGLNAALLAAADDSAGVWGVRLTRTEVGELEPPAELVESVRAGLKAELDRRTRITEAQGENRARLLRAESERDADLMAARARAEVAKLDAESSERSAEGDARATLMLSRAVEQGSVHALNYLLARQYVDALRTLAESDNGRFVILPLENGGVAASLTGIRELAEATFPEAEDLFAEPRTSAAPAEPTHEAPTGTPTGTPTGAAAAEPSAPAGAAVPFPPQVPPQADGRPG